MCVYVYTYVVVFVLEWQIIVRAASFKIQIFDNRLLRMTCYEGKDMRVLVHRLNTFVVWQMVSNVNSSLHLKVDSIYVEDFSLFSLFRDRSFSWPTGDNMDGCRFQRKQPTPTERSRN